MIKAFILRVLSTTYDLHLVTPLIIFVIVESVWGWWAGEVRGLWSLGDWRHYWWSAERLRGLVPVYLTFFVVLLILGRKEAAAQTTDIGAVDDALRNARTYFAISPTTVREWFDPASQARIDDGV